MTTTFRCNVTLLQSDGSHLTLGARSDDLVGIFKGLWVAVGVVDEALLHLQAANCGSLEELEPTHSVRLQAVGPPDALYRTDADPDRFTMAAPVVAFWHGPAKVEATTRSATSEANGGMREGRALSRHREGTPSALNRSCQRQMTALAFPVRRMISGVPWRRGQQDDLGPSDMLLRTVPMGDNRLQLGSVGGAQFRSVFFRAFPRLA
jgi:hypothetical protein